MFMKKLFLKFISFCIVGGLAALVELISFNLFFYFNTPFILSKIFGILIALCFNFFFNRKYTFLATEKKIKKQVHKFLIVYLVAFLVNVSVSVFVKSFVPQGILYTNIAVALGIIAQIPISFFGSLFWTFKK